MLVIYKDYTEMHGQQNMKTHLFPSGPFPSGFPSSILLAFLVSPSRPVCHLHLIILDLFNLMFIMISGEYKVPFTGKRNYRTHLLTVCFWLTNSTLCFCV